MQQQPCDLKQIKDILHNPQNIRFRKISLSGSTTQVTTNYPMEKVKAKQFVLELPQNTSEQPQESVSIRVTEDDFYRKYKADSGIKSLLKAYDQTRKKNSSECMTKIGLDVMKIKSFSANKPEPKVGSTFPAPIHSKKSLKKFQIKHLINMKDVLLPVKARSGRRHKDSEEERTKEVEFRHLIEMTTSLSNFPQKGQDEMMLTSRKPDLRKTWKKESKTEDYLYKRLQGTEKALKQEQNQIYDKRIKSFLQFLWKNQYAHGIYISLDIKADDLNARPKKLKAYVAAGNNGAMVKGLLKRRFWWTLVDERTPDCQFVWTQLKVNAIFDKQKRTPARKPLPKEDIDWQQQQQKQKRRTKSITKMRLSKLLNPPGQMNNQRIMHKEDTRMYKRYWDKHERDRQRDIAYKAANSPKELEIIKGDNRVHTIHNHLQNNFYLGNKKALFYNLREYYSLQGQSVFDRLPLTFHIRKGMKDPEYIRFVEYYKRRAKMMLKEAKDEEYEGAPKKPKTRNIWIVKPGQNSNQGQGITVIDEIYELNSIIKEGRSSSCHGDQSQHTYIVQMYLDRPLLYNNRKFDIRHFMLITNFFGITRSYWYQDGYIRTSSYQFDIDNFQPQIHLTNDSIQKRYQDYGKYEQYNKMSYEEFQRYLDQAHGKKYSFREDIIPKMKQMATDAARSVFTKISPKNQMNNFEIFGLDFMIDRNFQPWLIEINTNPCLDCASPLLNRIIPYMIEQSFKLSLDLAHPPPTHYPNTCKHFAPFMPLQIFKYELIFDSQHDGSQLTKMYKRVRSNFSTYSVIIVEQIGELQDDEEFKDEGNQCKLDDYT